MTLAGHRLKPYSVDGFLGGQVTLVQPRSGHRAGLDAALLQALAPGDAVGHAVDLGSGAGAVALSLAARAPGLTVTGVERDPDLVAYARQALGHPGNTASADRVRFVQCDVTGRREARHAAGLPDGSADWVLFNPPFDVQGTVRESHDPARRFAHVAEPGALTQWFRTAAGLLRPGGKLGVIQRASSLSAILQALEGRFGDARILPVYPVANAPASRILIRAVAASRAGLHIAPRLVLHDEHGGWTAEADAILRGHRHLAE